MEYREAQNIYILSSNLFIMKKVFLITRFCFETGILAGPPPLSCYATNSKNGLKYFKILLSNELDLLNDKKNIYNKFD